jgi:hypothetical protein
MPVITSDLGLDGSGTGGVAGFGADAIFVSGRDRGIRDRSNGGRGGRDWSDRGWGIRDRSNGGRGLGDLGDGSRVVGAQRDCAGDEGEHNGHAAGDTDLER